MTAPCTIDDKYAVFVSTSGSDGGTGRSTDPARTIGEGIVAAVAQQKSRVYVCRGTYTEQVVIDARHDGVSVYGGFACSAG